MFAGLTGIGLASSSHEDARLFYFQGKIMNRIQETNVQGLSGEPKASEGCAALADLANVIERYDNIVKRLHDRLDSVVAPSAPAVEDSTGSKYYETKLAQRINTIRGTAKDFADDLESLLERIEL